MAHKQQYSSRGFGIVELVIVAAISMIVLAIATPTLLQAYRSYRLSSAAAQVEMMLKYTRLEAIRQNTPINLNCNQQPNGNYLVWTNSNKTVAVQSTDKQTSFNSTAQLMPLAAVPSTASIAGSSNVGVAQLTGVAPGNGVMLGFDQRGAVANAAGVYAFAVGNTASPTAGYRIVVLLPSGSTQIWSGDANGNWHQTN